MTITNKETNQTKKSLVLSPECNSVDDIALQKIIDKLQKHFRLKTTESCDRLMIKLFMNMPINDLKNRIEVMPIKWKTLNPTRIHILEIAKIIYDERTNKHT